jgi:hypothetical protein
MADGKDDGFYAGIPVFDGFRSLMDPALYTALPDDWTIGLADIVDSTGAIAAGRYKVVNMAGAAVIASVTNGLGGRGFPFVFGGDGASFAVGPEDVAAAREALAATARWVADDLILTMRAALVPVSELRKHGFDVRVARFAPSPNVSYAMFSGGGLGWAEAAMKRGAFAVLLASADVRPDLTGLSCRFEQIPSRRGVILSVLVTQAEGGDEAGFRTLIEELIALVERSPEAGRPVPADGPPLRWPPQGIDLEARRSFGGPLVVRRAAVLALTLYVYLIMRFRISIAGFVPANYIEQVVQNSDFRKYDDGLRMVLDCTPQLADAIRSRLEAAERAGIARFGLHSQGAAMMTCFTPSALRNDHVHFIDGAEGGYASAATALKASALTAAKA